MIYDWRFPWREDMRSRLRMLKNPKSYHISQFRRVLGV